MKFFGGKIKLFDKFQISGRSGDGDPYLTRWRIIDSKWFGVFLHKMHRPDASPILHDHPWVFASFVLRGGYIEKCRDMSTAATDDPFDAGVQTRHIRRFNFKSLKDAHFISRLARTPTWTLVFVGPTKRVWGYWEMLTSSQMIFMPSGRILGPGRWYRTVWHSHYNHAPQGPTSDPFVNDGE